MCVYIYILFISSVEQMQLDFVEMLRVRDEKRRMRHVETLRRQKEVGEDGAEANREEGGGLSGGARVELLGDLDEGQGSAPPLVKTKPQPPQKTASYNPSSSSSSSSKTSTNITDRQVRIKPVTSFHRYERNIFSQLLTIFYHILVSFRLLFVHCQLGLATRYLKEAAQ